MEMEKIKSEDTYYAKLYVFVQVRPINTGNEVVASWQSIDRQAKHARVYDTVIPYFVKLGWPNNIISD